MQEIGFQLYQDVGDDEMRIQMSTTSRRNVNLTGAFGDVPLGLCSIETGNRYGLRRWSINQIPVVEQLVDDLSSSVDLQSTESFDGVEVLHIQRSQTGGVQV
jgi:hypothetical protein